MFPVKSCGSLRRVLITVASCKRYIPYDPVERCYDKGLDIRRRHDRGEAAVLRALNDDLRGAADQVGEGGSSRHVPADRGISFGTGSEQCPQFKEDLVISDQKVREIKFRDLEEFIYHDLRRLAAFHDLIYTCSVISCRISPVDEVGEDKIDIVIVLVNTALAHAGLRHDVRHRYVVGGLSPAYRKRGIQYLFLLCFQIFFLDFRHDKTFSKNKKRQHCRFILHIISFVKSEVAERSCDAVPLMACLML